MKYIQYLFLVLIITIPFNVFGGSAVTQSGVSVITTDRTDEEAYAYYDLRNRKTYIQVTNDEAVEPTALPTLCVHIQIFQQDKSCDELNFEDVLTPNDTVVYDLDNLVRNNGTEVPINLADDSYGIVTISAYRCVGFNDPDSPNFDNDDTGDPILGNFRIIDDAGYEYRMNLITKREDRILLEENRGTNTPAYGNIVIPFNTVDGATNADIVAFITEEDRNPSGIFNNPNNDLVYNEEVGITFDVFQIDENEERLSCDQKTFGCGPNVVLNYGINEDYPASRGENLLCEGAGLLPDQKHGYISLENASFLSPVDTQGDDFEFICIYGLNNGNGTGSMDECLFECTIENCAP